MVVARRSGAATEAERRILIDELIGEVEVHNDHLEVIVRRAPKLNVTLAEVGLSSVVWDLTYFSPHDANSYTPVIAPKVGAGIRTYFAAAGVPDRWSVPLEPTSLAGADRVSAG